MGGKYGAKAQFGYGRIATLDSTERYFYVLRNPRTHTKRRTAQPAQRLYPNFRNFVELTSLSKSGTMKLRLQKDLGLRCKNKIISIAISSNRTHCAARISVQCVHFFNAVRQQNLHLERQILNRSGGRGRQQNAV